MVFAFAIPTSMILRLVFVAVALALVFSVVPAISRWTKLPMITLYLAGGVIGQLAFGAPVLRVLMPAHNAALGCITIAAGSELVIGTLKSNARTIACLTAAMSILSLAMVWAVSLPVLSHAPRSLGGGGKDVRLHIVVAMFAGVIAIARSPSSAIAVVSELRADGPFTQTVLGVTMVTDVVVILLFAACTELADALLTQRAGSSFVTVAGSFSGRVLAEMGCSTVHGLVLAGCTLLVLRLPRRLGLRHAGLLLVAGYAFAAQSLLRTVAEHPLVVPFFSAPPRLEPMLSCIIAGFLVCNVFSQRRELSSLLSSTMPPVLCFFFFTTGIGMHLGVLISTWPMAASIFVTRLLALRLGCWIGCAVAGAPPLFRQYGWLAYVTQAGMSLGLAGELAEKFPTWGSALESTLMSVILLNQLVGPPLLEFALRGAGEDGCGAFTEAEEEAQLSPGVSIEAFDLANTGNLPPTPTPVLARTLIDSRQDRQLES
mmetsp:Transcript_65799/g.109334  ORF Transcript_65799/g.109334 Transcript_65799/m.109334 type:complete len:486 (-) Transcript_65799:193-1650(-)